MKQKINYDYENDTTFQNLRKNQTEKGCFLIQSLYDINKKIFED